MREARTVSYDWYIVGLLTAAYLLSLVDRILLSLLVEPIRIEMGLSDPQLGLLLGFAFVLFYSTLGIPLGSLADRGNRRNLIVWGVTTWSIATMACGIAPGFAALLLARMMVGAGEAVLFPAAISTFGDRFSKAQLGLAMSIFSLGALAGMGLAMSGGGLLVRWATGPQGGFDIFGWHFSGWRQVLIIVGLFGLPLALLIRLTMREAPRKNQPMRPPAFADVLQAITSRPRASFGLFAGFGAQVLSTYVPMTWAAAYYQRAFGMDAPAVGLALGAIFAIAGGLGLLVGGRWSDRMSARGVVGAPVDILLYSIPLQLPLIALAVIADTATGSLLALGGLLFVASFYGGLQGTTVSMMSPPGMQGRMMAIYLLVVTLFGMGAGPLLVGILSQRAFPTPGGLGIAMGLVMAGAIVIAAVVLLIARPAMRAAMREVADASDPAGAVG